MLVNSQFQIINKRSINFKDHINTFCVKEGTFGYSNKPFVKVGFLLVNRNTLTTNIKLL